jgi:hypothetical protein
MTEQKFYIFSVVQANAAASKEPAIKSCGGSGTRRRIPSPHPQAPSTAVLNTVVDHNTILTTPAVIVITTHMDSNILTNPPVIVITTHVDSKGET